MLTTDEVMQYEPVSDTMTWSDLKKTRLYQLYLRHSVQPELATIKTNVDLVMQGRIPDSMIQRYGFTKHDTHAPWKLYQYLRVALKRISKNS